MPITTSVTEGTPRITSLILSYNRPLLLDRAIRSARRQTYKNIEIKIFDNCSNKQTRQVIEKHSSNDRRITPVFNSTNIGAEKNFLQAFSSVETEYFSVMSDDDGIIDTLYADCVQILDEHASLGFVATNVIVADSHGRPLFIPQETHDIRHHTLPNRVERNNCPITWTGMLFRREVAHLFTTMDLRHELAADIRFLMRAKARYPYAHLDKNNAFYTIHDESYSTSVAYAARGPEHHVVMLSRHLEVLHDDKVSEAVKLLHRKQIRKTFGKSLIWQQLLSQLRLLYNLLHEHNTNTERALLQNIETLDKEGYRPYTTIFKLLLTPTSKLLLRPLVQLVRACRRAPPPAQINANYTEALSAFGSLERVFSSETAGSLAAQPPNPLAAAVPEQSHDSRKSRQD